MRQWIIAGCATLAFVGIAGLTQAGLRDDAIKKVMKEAMKDGLCKTVATGQGTAEQKKDLLGLFEELAAATPPKGEAGSWKEKTSALVTAAKAAVDGKGDAGALLKSAANCKACHDVHKGE